MELRELGDRLAGDVVLPGDEAWDTARQAWNLAVDQRPVAVVYPESADDVVGDRPVRRGARPAHRVQRRRPQRRPDRLEPGHAAPEDGADARDRDRRRCATRARRGGRALEAARGRGRRARPRLSRRHVAGRRRARLRARRRPQLDGPHVRARLQQHRRGRRGHGRRPAASGRTATPSPSCSGRSAAEAATSPP